MTLGEACAVGFTLGVTNGLHCAGMCGVFALRAASGSRWAGVLRFASYASGKSLTYVMLGAFAGYAGARAAAHGEQLRAVLGSAVGLALVAGAAVQLIPAARTGAPTRAAMALLRPILTTLGRLPGGFTLGAASGLLPCGLVYLALLAATATSDLLKSMSFMLAFSLGTVPALALAGFGGRGLAARIAPQRLRLAGGLVLLAMGCVTTWRAAAPWLHEIGIGASACCH